MSPAQRSAGAPKGETAMRSLSFPPSSQASIVATPLAFAAQQATGTVKAIDMHAMTLTLNDGTTYRLPQRIQGPRPEDRRARPDLVEHAGRPARRHGRDDREVRHGMPGSNPGPAAEGGRPLRTSRPPPAGPSRSCALPPPGRGLALPMAARTTLLPAIATVAGRPRRRRGGAGFAWRSASMPATSTRSATMPACPAATDASATPAAMRSAPTASWTYVSDVCPIALISPPQPASGHAHRRDRDVADSLRGDDERAVADGRGRDRRMAGGPAPRDAP